LQPQLQLALLAWWAGTRAERDALPWRSTRDPWAVLVSETMLAQTQAVRVAARYPALIERFPVPAALAASPLGELLRLWSGLGYPRRAAALHAAAGAICERHGGEVPPALDELLGLPGVGAYTARAVLAFACSAPVGVVDTNVGRVLARAVAGRRLDRRSAQQEADDLSDAAPVASREWNLAMMDFGALVCRARDPGCASCPLRAAGRCAWRASSAAPAGAGPPDPALGSAGVSARQRRFPGSDRQGRGRLLRAACDGPVGSDRVADAAGWPDDRSRAERVARALVSEGLLAVGADGSLRLP
jgi:A/G-specific adenine glycosylase